jgi:hypothetical protein
VVADRRERRGETREDAVAGVVDWREAAVHRLGRVVHGAAEQVADALVAEADAEQRQPRLADRGGADAEVGGPIGPARTGRGHHTVEPVEVDVRPLGVVADDDRRPPVHLPEQLIEV